MSGRAQERPCTRTSGRALNGCCEQSPCGRRLLWKWLPAVQHRPPGEAVGRRARATSRTDTDDREIYGERDEPFKTRTTSDYSNTWAAAHTMTSAAVACRANTFSARWPTSYSGAGRHAGPRTTGGTAYPALFGDARRQGAPESQSSGSSAWLDARVCRHRRSGARPTSLQGQTDRQIIGRHQIGR